MGDLDHLRGEMKLGHCDIGTKNMVKKNAASLLILSLLAMKWPRFW